MPKDVSEGVWNWTLLVAKQMIKRPRELRLRTRLNKKSLDSLKGDSSKTAWLQTSDPLTHSWSLSLHWHRTQLKMSQKHSHGPNCEFVLVTQMTRPSSQSSNKEMGRVRQMETDQSQLNSSSAQLTPTRPLELFILADLLLINLFTSLNTWTQPC